MLSLIILIVFGLGTAYFATQNTGTVHILVGSYLLQGIPLYVIVITSILLGVFISWLVSIVDSISSTRVIYGKDSAIKKARAEIEKLEEENHNLEIENVRLKAEIGDPEALETERRNVNVRPSFLQRIKHSFG